MIISPQKILDDKIVKNILHPEQLQPNSIDLTLNIVAEIQDNGQITRIDKTLPQKKFLEADSKEFFTLEKGKCYDIEFNEWITVPDNMLGIITHRSTLNRMGGIITAGIFDSGFNNKGGAVLRLFTNIRIQRNARIATIIFIKAESVYKYNGSYQFRGENKNG